ncbi:MAG TPA: M48 family metallopeptidase, partial [Verrucomicrobiae bacterium]|nr:M48 family metallopeptidase [Verrucomicrobiae bacterium]
MKSRHFLVFLLIAAAGASGCDTLAPFVQDFNIISIPQEKEIGAQMAQEVAKQMQINTDSALNERVSAIGRRLVNALPQRDFDYQFSVVNDDTPNAFTIPGAHIYVHTGLLKFVSDDDELAGVIGHEIGHAYERHPAKGISRQYGLEHLAGIVLKGHETQLRSMTLQIIGGGFLSKYGRDDEREADEIGFLLARRAGYDGDGLLRFLKKLLTITGNGPTLIFFQSHPPTPERIARLEALAKGAPVSFPAPSNGLAMAPLAYQPQAPRAAYAVQPAYAAPAPSASYPPARR